MNETDYNARLYEKMKADWQEDGVKVSKGAKSLSILEPVEYANRRRYSCQSAVHGLHRELYDHHGQLQGSQDRV